MYFRNLRAQKTRLDKCLKGLVLEDPRRDDMVNGRKHWFNINESAFIILSDHFKLMESQKSLLETWKCFSLFLKTLTPDDKYSPISRDNWMQTIQKD